MSSKLVRNAFSIAILILSFGVLAQTGITSGTETIVPSRGQASAHSGESLREVFEGATVFQRISETEPTRLVIPGSRIKRTTYVKSDLSVVDDGTGAAFIQPLVNNKRLSIFVTLESGATFTLVLQTEPAMAASSIRLTERRDSTSSLTMPLNKPEVLPAAQRSISYESAIHELVMAAATGRLDQGMEATAKNVEFSLWAGSRFVLQRSISSMDMTVDVFALTNLSKEPMRVVEQELYRQTVLAVAIESHLLNPGDTTTVYIVRAME
ncbi:MAG: hypothetical protein HC858_10995 [Brachymonas sp.]|nr:hypothetical protein [Brachymonas sp.]